jgi:methionyl aminopeptidase
MEIRLKSEADLEGIRTSCRLLSDTFRYLRELVEPGISTGELDAKAQEYIDKLGGRPSFLGYHGFPGALCTSVNEEVIHGIPGSRVLAPGDVLSIDCGIEYKGYHSDAALSIPIGSVSQDISELLATTQEALFKGIEAARYGNRIHDISKAVYGHTSPKGYGVVREYCGHGVGFDIHEDPQVPNYASRGPNPRLKPGMVLAIEPMINLGTASVRVLDDDWTVVTADRSVSAHFEHTVAILRDRTEVLTEW